MSEKNIKKIQDYIAQLEKRAAKSQSDAKRKLNPLFKQQDDRGRPPRDFVESSFLFMRSCDGDIGNRPTACPAFWLSPDLRVAPVDNVGMPTRELEAGKAYRFTATVRNRGDLIVPSAKVEFFLTNPSLGFDTRFATHLGVAAGWVNPYAAAEVHLPYLIPPNLTGHRCLFARVFSFSPLDVPIDDYALNPVLDRHVAQLNLNIVPQATNFMFDWIHLPNAFDRIEIMPMTANMLRVLRNEAVTNLKLVNPARWEKMQARVEFSVERTHGQKLEVKQEGGVLHIQSRDDKAVPFEKQQEIERAVQAIQRTQQKKRLPAEETKKVFAELRAMNKQAERTVIALKIPDLGLRPGQAIPLNLIKRNAQTGEITGGIALFIAG